MADENKKKLTQEEIAQLTLEHLKHIRTGVDRLENDMRDIKFRVQKVEETLLHHTHQFDRLGERLFRIENRLELADAPAE